MYAATAGYPYFVQAYGKVAWDVAPRSPITADDVRVAAPEAEAELAVGFFGSRYERATPAEREYLRAMADAGGRRARRRGGRGRGVATSAIAELLGRKPQSLSPGPGRADQEGPGLQRRARVGSPSRCRTSAGTCAGTATETAPIRTA